MEINQKSIQEAMAVDQMWNPGPVQYLGAVKMMETNMDFRSLSIFQ